MTPVIFIAILAVFGSFVSALLGFFIEPHTPSSKFKYSRLPKNRTAPKYYRTSKNIHPAKYCPPHVELNKSERLFSDVLVKAVGDSCVTFTKVPVANVLAPAQEDGWLRWRGESNKLSDEYFDFVICAADGSATKLAIQIDDAKNTSAKQQLRDQLLTSACESAGLPLVRIMAARGYALGNVKERIAPVLADPEVAATAGLHATR